MAEVLLLNASYEPLAVITRRRAVSLLLKGRVEAACTEEVEIQGVSNALAIPTVIRLHRYINVPQRGVRWSKQAVLRRDRYTCAYCGIRPGDSQHGQALPRHNFTVDHILPVSRGGKNSWGNTVCACPVCNQRKGNRTPDEANMKLRWEPKRPRVNYLVVSGEIPATWKIYLEV
jgi:5-methylcytosine-specific restriction endonuclease McrA